MQVGFWEEADVAREWRRMISIRRFEEAMIQHGDAFPGHRHVYIGQEATAIGVLAAVDPDAAVVTTHRNHGHNLARGADPGACMAEIFGKAAGSARGKSGTFHIASPAHRVLVASAVVAGSLGIALGLALAEKHRGSGRIAVAFFGDGALNEGTFHETANLAGLWRTPYLMVCENNNGSAPPSDSGLAGPSITGLAAAYGIETQTVDGSDVDAVFSAVRRAAEKMKNHPAPFFLEARTVGWPGNRGGWPHLVDGPTRLADAWRTPVPEDGWGLHDPVLKFARDAVARRILDADALASIDQEVVLLMEHAVNDAKAAPYPKPEEALEDLWA